MATATPIHIVNRPPPPQPFLLALSLDKWKQRLFRNANETGHLRNLRNVPGVIMELAWADGYQPTVNDLVKFCGAPRRL